MQPSTAGDDVMPEESRKKLRFANLSRQFVQMAKLGSESDQAQAIARRHLREMQTEFAQLIKVKKKKASNKTTAPDVHTASGTAPATGPTTSAPSAQRAVVLEASTGTPAGSARNVQKIVPNFQRAPSAHTAPGPSPATGPTSFSS